MKKMLLSVANLTTRNEKQCGITLKFNGLSLQMFRADESMTFAGLVQVCLNSPLIGCVTVSAQKLGAALEYLIESESITFNITPTSSFMITGEKGNHIKSFSLDIIDDDSTSFDLIQQVIDASSENLVSSVDLDINFCKSFGKILSDQRLKPNRIQILSEPGMCFLHFNILGVEQKIADFRVSAIKSMSSCLMSIKTQPLASILKICASNLNLSVGTIREVSFLKINVIEGDWLQSTYLIASIFE